MKANQKQTSRTLRDIKAATPRGMEKLEKLPAMTRAEWQQLPESVRYFHPWRRASKPLQVTR